MRNARIVLAFLLTSTLFATPASTVPPPASPAYQSGFPVDLSGNNVRNSSIALGDLTGDGIPEIVIGGSDGRIYAYRGNGTLLWERTPGTMAIEGKAAIGDVDGDGFAEVVFGVGSTFTGAAHGRLYVYDHQGNEQCRVNTLDITGDGFQEGVFSSPAIADLDRNDGGRLEIVFGAWDHRLRAVNHDCTLLWMRDVFDTIWSSPAIADLDRNGTLEVIVGADSHFEPQPIGTLDGGRLFVVDGATGVDRAGFPIQINEVITSSPAIGDVNGDGFPDIVVGTGNCWGAGNGCGVPPHPNVGEYVNVWDRNGNYLPGWPKAITGRIANGSPALADLDENDGGALEIIVNAAQRGTNPQNGFVYVWNGDGSSVAGWPVQPSTPADCNGGVVRWATPASPVVADVLGDGHLQIILPSNGELVIWNRLGQQLTRTALVPPICTPPDANSLLVLTNWSINGSAGIGDIDGDGDLEVIVGGYEEFNQPGGALWAWDFPGSSSGNTPWPVFRGSQDNRGVVGAGVPLFADDFESGDTSAWSSTLP